PDGIYCPWSPAHRRPPSPTVPGVPVHPLMPADPEAIGPYRLLARLGEGGMGRVYLGISRSGRLLAVKAVRSDLAADPDFRTRFAREVDAARLVSGVFSAPLVDADPRAETPWMATGFVAGGSLREVVERAGPLPAEAAAVLAVGLAEALRAVHSAGLVHRDLKPGNVLLAADGPRILDFGVARALDSDSAPRTGEVVGVQWMSVSGSIAGYRLWRRPRTGSRLGGRDGRMGGHRGVQVAGAGPGPARRPRLGRLLARGRAALRAHRPRPVPRGGRRR